jgi:hypothetical protein
MIETMTGRRVDFTLSEAAQITQLRPQAIRDWVMYGHIVPLVRGTSGPGNQHRFSGQQLIGMAAVSAMAAHRWCSKDQAIEVLRTFAEMSDLALMDELGMGDAAGHAEEAAAAFALKPLFMNRGLPRSPRFEEVLAEMNRRIDKAGEAIRRRLLGQRDRFSRPAKKR